MTLLTLSLVPLLFSAVTSCSPLVTRVSSAVPINKQIASLSIEFCYVLDYFGDIHSSNKLSKRLLQNIQDISGLPPIIRIGGDTQDSSRYCSNCTETLVNTFVPGNTEAANTTFNKNLFSVLNNNVPSKQQFIFGLNLGQDQEIFPQEEVEAAEKYISDSRIWSYELGNEPEYYASSRRTPPWNVQVYTAQIISWIQQIQASTKTKRGWQVGALAQPPIYQGNFSIAEFNVLGVPEKIQPLLAYSDHTYPYSICNPTTAALVSLPGLMNHTATVNLFSQWIPSIQAAHSVGTLFHMGETGSVSCHGKKGVSNTMGAALWELDYVLNGATIGMDGVFFHMGTPFFYSMWQPVAYNGTAATVYPGYNTLIIMATALADLKTPYVATIASPSDSPNLVIYALYPSAPASSSSAPKKLIVLNLDYYGSTSTGARPTKSVNAGSILQSNNVRVSRFTAAAADATSGATFAGQDWENGGVVSGKKVYEKATGGIVEIGASEGMLIEVC